MKLKAVYSSEVFISQKILDLIALIYKIRNNHMSNEITVIRS